jgi:hypothetical protein
MSQFFTQPLFYFACDEFLKEKPFKTYPLTGKENKLVIT